MTKEFTIEEIDALLEGATPGPWALEPRRDLIVSSEPDPLTLMYSLAHGGGGYIEQMRPTMALAASAPDLAAALKRSLEREAALTKRLDALRSAFDKWTDIPIGKDTDVILDAFNSDDEAAKEMVES